MSLRRLTFVVALVATAALTLSACKTSSADLAAKNPKAAMAAASKRTADAKTVRLALAAATQTGVSVLSGRGAYDFTTKDGRFKLSTVSGSSVEMVITPRTMYVKLPQPSEGHHWLSLTDADLARANADPSTAGAQSALLLDNIRDQVDPRSTIDALGENVPGLRKVGTEKIRGVTTTHLRGRVDLSDKAIAAAPSSKRAALQRARTTFGPDGYPVDIWLDVGGRVRRVQYVLESGTAGQKTSTTVRLDLFSFGGDSGIEIPNASDVGDGSALLHPGTTVAPKN